MRPWPRICVTSASPSSDQPSRSADGPERLRGEERDGQQHQRGDGGAPRHQPRGGGAGVARRLDRQHVAGVERAGQCAERVAQQLRAARRRSWARRARTCRRWRASCPTRNVRVTCCFQNSQPASVTKMGARLASSVELATEVKRIEKCHTPRSAAKKRPAPKQRQRRHAHRRAGLRAPRACSTHAQSRGAASAQRQKALATGPVSARRTRMGANAMAQPPTSRHAKAPPAQARRGQGSVRSSLIGALF